MTVSLSHAILTASLELQVSHLASLVASVDTKDIIASSQGKVGRQRQPEQLMIGCGKGTVRWAWSDD